MPTDRGDFQDELRRLAARDPQGPCKEALGRFVAAFNRGDVDDAAALLSDGFWQYQPREGEPTQSQAFAEVMAGVRSGLPDGTLTLADIREDGRELLADAVFAGHFSGTMFGVHGLGQPFELQALLRSRYDDEAGLVIAIEGVQVPVTLRILGVIPYLSFAHLVPEEPSRLPEVLYRLAFGGNSLAEKQCEHLDEITVVEVTGDTCAACVAVGAEWPALRQCLTCGHVGCCDLSVNKHAKAHSEETGHPLVRSATPGEAWIWCYPDSAILSSWHLREAEHTTRRRPE